MKDTVQISEGLAVAKFAPDARTFAQIAEEGFRSVVNLRTKGEPQAISPEEERQLVESAGLTYLHHPVAGNQLSEHVVDGFREQVRSLPTPVLVHCASGRRAGAMVLMYQGAERKMSSDDLVAKARSLGLELGSAELEDFVRRYVENKG